MCYEVCLGFDLADGCVDADGFSLVSFSFVPIDFCHSRWGDVVDYESFDSRCRGSDGIEIDIVGADSAKSRQEGRFGEESCLVDFGGPSGETEAADRLEDPTVSQ